MDHHEYVCGVQTCIACDSRKSLRSTRSWKGLNCFLGQRHGKAWNPNCNLLTDGMSRRNPRSIDVFNQNASNFPNRSKYLCKIRELKQFFYYQKLIGNCRKLNALVISMVLATPVLDTPTQMSNTYHEARQFPILERSSCTIFMFLVSRA